MEPVEKRQDKENQPRTSSDPRERLQQNPLVKSEESQDQQTSQGDKNDLLNQDPDEERREIEKSSEDKLSSAE